MVTFEAPEKEPKDPNIKAVVAMVVALGFALCWFMMYRSCNS